MGAGPVDLFLLRVVLFHVDDALIVDGLPDASRLAAVGRLGGEQYCDAGSPIVIPRP